MRVRSGRALLLALAALAVGAASAQASPLTATSPVQVSGTNPFAGCPASSTQGGTNFLNSEVEPWVTVNPTDADDDDILGDNIVVYYKQDRWSNGGSKGLVAAVSFDDGVTWTQTFPDQLTVGPDALFERASDPWISFSPNGSLHAISLVLDPDPTTGGFGDNGVVYNRSTDGGLTWEDPIVLRTDFDPNYLNDKESITADPNDSDFVYAVWDRVHDASRAQHAQTTPSASASRARSGSPAPPTAATPGSRLARSTRRVPTSRRSATRSSCARRARFSTSSATSSTARGAAAASGRS